MKLFYITNARIPTEKAHGYQICKMCEEFAHAGSDVELIVPVRKNNIKKDVFEFYGIEKNFKIKQIKSFDFLIFNKYLGRLSFYLQSLSFLIKLFFIKIDNNAIIYTRNFEIAWLLRLRGHKTVYEAHSWPGSKIWIYKLLIKNIDKIVVITHGLKNLFLKNSFSENKILIAPDGVNLEKFDIDLTREQAREKLGLPQDKKIILYTGHLYKWKGAQILADVAELLDENSLIVFIGGTGKDEKEFRIKNKKLENILVAGYQPHSEIPYWLKAADVLVLPNSGKENISKFYTSPLKLFEYMASKRPIVASNLPSIREILNEHNAVLVEPDNPQSLDSGIKKVLQDSDLAGRISKQAFQDVQNYTWRNRVKNILNFIKN
ncbi:MAG: glycosyltransferase family 4 protein [bacterium]|nr:glycosyltransferase family 4 protein [bacterium]